MARKDTPYSDPERVYEPGAFLAITHETDSLEDGELDNLVNQIRESLINLRFKGYTSFSAIVVVNDCVEQRRVAANLLGGMLVAGFINDDVSYVDEALNTPTQLAEMYAAPGEEGIEA